MINIKEKIYEKLSTDAQLLLLIKDIFYKGNNKNGEQTQYPAVIFHRITGNTNRIWGRKEIFQISVRSESSLTNEIIMDRIALIFNRTNDPQYKYCKLSSITETYDINEKVNGTHLTFDFILYDSQF